MKLTRVTNKNFFIKRTDFSGKVTALKSFSLSLKNVNLSTSTFSVIKSALLKFFIIPKILYDKLLIKSSFLLFKFHMQKAYKESTL
jgi:hypothetical protein